MGKRCTLILILCVILSLTSCMFLSIKTEKPIEEISIVWDIPDNVIWFPAKIHHAIPMTSDTFLYSANRWVTDLEYNKKVGGFPHIASIYQVSLTGQISHLADFPGYHIDQINLLDDAYLLLLREVVHETEKLTLLCIDNDWAEKWRYPLESRIGSVFPSNGYITLIIRSPAESEYLSTSGMSKKDVIVFDYSGNELFAFPLADEESILNATYIPEKQSLYFIIRTNYMSDQYVLRALDNNFDIEYELELPIVYDLYPPSGGTLDFSEVIVKLVPQDNGLLLFTNYKTYDIVGQNVTVRASAAEILKPVIKRGEFTGRNILYPNDKFNYFYMGSVHKRKYGEIKMLICLSYDFDQSSYSIRMLDSDDRALCSYIDENGRIVMVTANRIGDLSVFIW